MKTLLCMNPAITVSFFGDRKSAGHGDYTADGKEVLARLSTCPPGAGLGNRFAPSLRKALAEQVCSDQCAAR